MLKYIKSNNGVLGFGDTWEVTYKGEFLGSWLDAEYPDCPELLDRMQGDQKLATIVLDFMNSLGDPVFPVSTVEWMTPETDVSKVDIAELYAEFMTAVDHLIQDGVLGMTAACLKNPDGHDLVIELVDSDSSLSITSSTDFVSDTPTSDRPMIVPAPRGDYYVWVESGKFKGSPCDPSARIVDARRIHTFDGFDSLSEVVDYVKKYF